MLYSKVFVESFGYELPPNVVTSADIENRLEPFYAALHFQKGQLEALTGIQERRFWDNRFKMSAGAIKAAQKAIAKTQVPLSQIGMLIYGGVCRDNLEPATACAVADGLNLAPQTLVYDVSNACLGVLNGMVEIANAIELGQIGAGIVVSCESAAQIIDTTIERLLQKKDIDSFKKGVATLTGGSGAVAMILTAESVSARGKRLLGGTCRSAPQYHHLCTWGPDNEAPNSEHHIMQTDSTAVLQNGVVLGLETYALFKQELGWTEDPPDKIICHQVGATHQDTILNAIGIPKKKDFTTFKYLGNIGTVSLPITAAIADERGFLEQGDRVAFLGIGSGLNCLMLGLKW